MRTAAGEIRHVELVPQLGHKGAVGAVAWSSDGRLFATGGGAMFGHGREFDGTVKIWKMDEQGQPLLLATLPGRKPTEFVKALQFSGDSRFLAAASIQWLGDGSLPALSKAEWTVRLFETRTGTLVSSIEGNEGPVADIRFDPQGRLYAGGLDGHVRVYNLESSRLRSVQELNNTNPVTALTLCGQNLLVGDDTGRVALWSANQFITATNAAGKRITCLAADAAARCVAVCSGDDHIRVLDVAAWKVASSQRSDQSGIVAAVFGKKALYTAGWDHMIGVREIRTFNLVQPLFPGHNDAVTSLALSPDAQKLLSGSQEYFTPAKIWDLQKELPLAALPATPVRRDMQGITIACHSNYLAMAGAHDTTIRIWDLKTGSMLHEFGQEQAHAADILCLAFSPDGAALASGSCDGSVKVWSVGGGGEVKTLPVGAWAIGVAWSLDGKLLAVGGAADWNASSGKVLLWDLSGPGPPVCSGPRDTLGRPRSLAFSGDSLFVGCSEGTSGTIYRWVSGWNWTPGEGSKRHLRQSEVFAEAGSICVGESLLPNGDGTSLVSAGKTGLSFWSVQTRTQIWTMPFAHKDLVRLALSDSTGFYSGSWDGTVAHRDFKGQLLKVLKLDNRVDSLAIDGAGHLITSTSDGARAEFSVQVRDTSHLAADPKLAIYLMPGNQWLAYQPRTHRFSGSLGGSADAARIFAVRFGSLQRTYRLSDQFFSHLKRSPLLPDASSSDSRVLCPPSWFALHPNIRVYLAALLCVAAGFWSFFRHQHLRALKRLCEQAARDKEVLRAEEKARFEQKEKEKEAEQRALQHEFFKAYMESFKHTSTHLATGLEQLLAINKHATQDLPLLFIAQSELELLACRISALVMGEQGAFAGAASWIAIPDLLETVSQRHRRQCAHKQPEFVLQNEVCQKKVYINIPIVQMILDELLDNAVKYTARGYIRLAIRSVNVDTIIFEIVNTGCGIPSSESGRLFQPFFRSAQSKHLPGSGMGLAIAHKLAHLLKGSLVYEPAENTTFILEVPVGFEDVSMVQESAPPQDKLKALSCMLSQEERNNLRLLADNRDFQALESWTPSHQVAELDPLVAFLRSRAAQWDWDAIKDICDISQSTP